MPPKSDDEKGRGRQQEQVRRSARSVMRNVVDQDARDAAFDAIAKAKAHEELCEERWKNQAAALARVEGMVTLINAAMADKIGKLPAGIIAALTGTVGFLAHMAFSTH